MLIHASSIWCFGKQFSSRRHWFSPILTLGVYKYVINMGAWTLIGLPKDKVQRLSKIWYAFFIFIFQMNCWRHANSVDFIWFWECSACWFYLVLRTQLFELVFLGCSSIMECWIFSILVLVGLGGYCMFRGFKQTKATFWIICCYSRLCENISLLRPRSKLV